MSYSIWIIVVTLIFVLLVSIFKEKWSGTIALLAVLLNTGISSSLAIGALSGIQYQEVFNGGSIFGDIPIRVDSLSAWFILLMNFTVLTGILYGRQYMKQYEHKTGMLKLHFANFIINHFSMIGIFMVQNSLAFLYVWEIMALTSFILVIFEFEKPETIKAGINFLIQSHVCILLLTLGFIWVSYRTGSYDFNAIGEYARSVSPSVSLALYMVFFTGFAIKAGFVPFHTWLPYAHPVAPSHVSGVMSGVMIKLGIFGILKLLLIVNQNYLIIGYFILVFSLISGLYGVILAIVQHNLKKLLAYHSIENIGIIGMGIGLGSIGVGVNNPILAFAGFAGALLHTLNHSLFKSLLFYSAGSIYQAIHTLNIDSMGGLIKKMPRTAFLFLIAAMAICGLPPFNGFISEFLIYIGLFEGIHSSSLSLTTVFIISFTGLVLIGGLALLCFTKAFGIVFLGSERTKFDHEITEAGSGKLFPGYLILFVIVFIGLFPQLFIRLLANPVSLFTGEMSGGITEFRMVGNLVSISYMSWAFIAVVILLVFIKKIVSDNRIKANAPTWGCAYAVPGSKMQYTASSYVRTYKKLLGPFLSIEKHEKDITGVFSDTIKSHSTANDKIEIALIDRPLRFINTWMGKVRFIQSGNVRHYILYGILFIFIIVVFSLATNGIMYLISHLKQI